MNTRRLLGDTVGRTIIKLVVVSLIVGAVMSVFGLAPLDIWFGLRDFVVSVWNSGWAALGRFGDWLILGASIVVPLFILARLLSYRSER
ncbi:MAG: DUF6460 domain-containing protein [Roseitalea porphyridii]|jgi:hypothetical protein|uniref:DUF6460 domain-containing protein n=1 Tax=Roseitalea porphyridii TaxID=1852022 RepID=A0A4P6UYQ1_9HYPH|nr:DUF6460 domain-containing protein [Roseitalea porphyridii]QBK29434.1 hypothetical protein E0E05_01785 [Roseitalea porphyridii]